MSYEDAIAALDIVHEALGRATHPRRRAELLGAARALLAEIRRMEDCAAAEAYEAEQVSDYRWSLAFGMA